MTNRYGRAIMVLVMNGRTEKVAAEVARIMAYRFGEGPRVTLMVERGIISADEIAAIERQALETVIGEEGWS